MVEQIRRFPGAEVTIIDNASTYAPLLKWYDELQRGGDVKVIRLLENLGKFAPWKCGAVDAAKSEYYVVTDPDLDLSGVPADALEVLRAGMERYEVSKAGLSLAIDDLPEDGIVGPEARHWESQWWKNSVDDRFFNAAIDTTFAMYKRSRGAGAQIRAKPPYTARHLPWYLTPATMTPEYRYYLSEASNVSDWGERMKLIQRDRDEVLAGRYVTFTFDDGDVETAMDVHRIMQPDHATFYIVPGWLGAAPMAHTMDDCNKAAKHGGDWDWRSISYWGHDVGSHTMSHCRADAAGAQAEYAESLEYIKRFGVGPWSLSFPFHMKGPVDAPYDSIRCGNSVRFNGLDTPLRELGSWTIYPDKFDEIVRQLRDLNPPDCHTIFCLHGLNGRLCHPSWDADQFMKLVDVCRALGYKIRSMAEMSRIRRSACLRAGTLWRMP